MTVIDLRSDTVTQPTPQMRHAMAAAAVGDDVFGDDPSVNALEERVAQLLGKDSAVLCASGTQSNLMAILSHCQRGEEYIVGQEYHTYRYEAGGAAVLGGIVPQTIEMNPDGTINLELLEKRIKPDDPHFPITRLIALENTHTGKVIPQSFMQSARKIADRHGLLMHLDGARLFNAAVASGSTVQHLAEPFDSVSVCFSKGLGTPVGSVLAGSSDFVGRARRWRKMLGGGMRQAGILAAAMDYALDHHVERLSRDHSNAQTLAEALSEITSLQVEPAETNMVYVNFETAEHANRVCESLLGLGIRVASGKRMRMVTHLGISEQDVLKIVNAFKKTC